MITLLFTLLMIAVFGRLLGFAIRMTWGILKVIGSLVILPALLIFVFIKGLFIIAFPVLAIIGLISLIAPKERNY